MRVAVRFGQHTDAILGELGWDQAAIDRLREVGAIQAHAAKATVMDGEPRRQRLERPDSPTSSLWRWIIGTASM